MSETLTAEEPVQHVFPKSSNSTSKSIRDEIEELNGQSARLHDLIRKTDTIEDAKAKELVQDCISEMISFYGNGLERILEIIMNNGGTSSTKIINDLIEDSFISGLLLIHDLHPLDLRTRLNLALEKVRPYMDSHGGNIEIISLVDGVAKLKLSGSCKGCASSSVTMELAVKEAIEENCPDLLELEVEGVVEPSPPKGNAKPETSCKQKSSPGWKTLKEVKTLPNGSMKFLEIDGVPVMISRAGDQLYAFRNNCPACDLALTSGTLENTIISCRLGHKYDMQQAGKCTQDPELHLDPFPLLEENGSIKIAVG